MQVLTIFLKISIGLSKSFFLLSKKLRSDCVNSWMLFSALEDEDNVPVSWWNALFEGASRS